MNRTEQERERRLHVSNSKRKLCLKMTKEALEQFLFSGTNIKIDHVEHAHDVDLIRIYLSGVGPNIAEGQAVAEVQTHRALQDIKQEIEECRLDRED